VIKKKPNPNYQRGVAMSITVTMSAVQSHTPDVTQTRCRTVAVHRRWGGSTVFYNLHLRTKFWQQSKYSLLYTIYSRLYTSL